MLIEIDLPDNFYKQLTLLNSMCTKTQNDFFVSALRFYFENELDVLKRSVYAFRYINFPLPVSYDIVFQLLKEYENENN